MNGDVMDDAVKRNELCARWLLQLVGLSSEGGLASRSVDPTCEERDATVALAIRHGLAPLLHRALQSSGEWGRWPDHLTRLLDEQRQATALANLQRYGEFRRITRVLGDLGIPVMALKGLHLAERAYGDISLRPMSDMDILVPRNRIREAIGALYGIGYGFDEELSAASDEVLENRYDVELLHRENGLLLEVHWTIDELNSGDPEWLDELWRDALPERLGDADTWVLPAEFLLLHVCAHLARKHLFDFSLRGLCDIAAIVQSHPGFDWAGFTARCRRHGLTRHVALALRLASDHLGVSVPRKIFEELEMDELNSGILALAMQQLAGAGHNPTGILHADNLMSLAAQPGWLARLRLICRKAFLSRPELAMIYGQPARGWRWPLFHAIRIVQLVQRYLASLWALRVSDPVLAEGVARRVRLAHWLDGPE